MKIVTIGLLALVAGLADPAPDAFGAMKIVVGGVMGTFAGIVLGAFIWALAGSLPLLILAPFAFGGGFAGAALAGWRPR